MYTAVCDYDFLLNIACLLYYVIHRSFNCVIDYNKFSFIFHLFFIYYLFFIYFYTRNGFFKTLIKLQNVFTIKINNIILAFFGFIGHYIH